MCELARELGGTDMNEMLYEAAAVGSQRLCHKALEWGAINKGNMLFGALRGCHPALCLEALDLLKSESAKHTGEANWWKDILEDALSVAVHEGVGSPADQETVCRQLVEWGADTCNLFAWAAENGNARLAWLALELKPNRRREYIDWIDEEGLEGGAVLLAWFILDNPKNSYDELLFYGTELISRHRGGGYELCNAALRGGALHVDWLLCWAAFSNREDLCLRALRHGARDFNGMLMAACAGDHGYLVELAQKWGATAPPPWERNLSRVRSQ